MGSTSRTPQSAGRPMRAGMSLPISCPKCGMDGLVDWKTLEHGIRCPHCECEFMVSRGGRVVLLAELPHLRYSCPRCGHNGATPSMVAARRVDCAHCKLSLMRGPDQRFYGEKEAAELWRAEGSTIPAAHRAGWRERLSGWSRTHDGRLHKLRIALAIAPIVALAFLGGQFILSVFDRSPETMARLFTEACLAGNAAATRAFLDDNDDVQRIEFDRWQLRHFASITQKHRPKGDDVNVEVQLVKDAPASRVFYVAMKSPFLGSRALIQHWRELETGWQFDAIATLSAEDGPRSFGAKQAMPLQRSADLRR